MVADRARVSPLGLHDGHPLTPFIALLDFLRQLAGLLLALRLFAVALFLLAAEHAQSSKCPQS